MSKVPLTSIVVNNYNYGRFLKEAVDSALNQTYPNTEVIVVDDGSTDNSREIIAGYGDRIIPVLKENGGQSSAFNAAFRVSRGDVIIFLDADDTLLPGAVEQAVKLFREAGIVKAHWPLRVIEASGEGTGRVMPAEKLPEGDFRELVVRYGPDKYLHPPTSGNAFARKFLEKVFPMPEMEKQFKLGDANGDAHLSALALLFGHIGQISEPQGCYRIHGKNGYIGLNFDGRLKRDLLTYDHRCASLANHCREMGISADPAVWKADSWLYRLRRAAEEIAMQVPPGEAFLLVDQDQWGMDSTAGRRALPFLERDGQYWGPPPDDETAVREFERLRGAGATFMVFAWPAFWWLDYYAGLQAHLQSRFRCVLENDRLVVFDLRPANGQQT